MEFYSSSLLFSVEPVHSGTSTNSVLYIPVGPDCPINRLYVERAKFLFRRGLGPPDFGGSPENEFEYEDRAGWEDLTEEARRMLGGADT